MLQLVSWSRRADRIRAWEVNAIVQALGPDGANELDGIRQDWEVYQELYCEVSAQTLLENASPSLGGRLTASTPPGDGVPPAGFDLFVRFSTRMYPQGDSFDFFILTRHPDDRAAWTMAFASAVPASQIHIDRARSHGGRRVVVYATPSGGRVELLYDRANGVFSTPG
jgi:hypothetical protein